jgi:hypothetical protein
LNCIASGTSFAQPLFIGDSLADTETLREG